MKGKFITFEGIDGSGKTTIANLLYERLRKEYDVILTSEPTKSWLGKAVRKAINENKDAVTIALLFVADRNEHVKEVKKWLNEGKLVICDRYMDSTFAYQKEHLKGIMRKPIQWLKNLHTNILIPDLTFLLKIDVEKALKRIDKRRLTIYENKEFLQRVQRNYIEMARKEKRFVIINADRKKEDILEECLSILNKLF